MPSVLLGLTPNSVFVVYFFLYFSNKVLQFIDFEDFVDL